MIQYSFAHASLREDDADPEHLTISLLFSMIFAEWNSFLNKLHQLTKDWFFPRKGTIPPILQVIQPLLKIRLVTVVNFMISLLSTFPPSIAKKLCISPPPPMMRQQAKPQDLRSKLVLCFLEGKHLASMLPYLPLWLQSLGELELGRKWLLY